MKEESRGRKDPGSSLRHRMELGRLILGITTRFVNIQPHETDAALKRSLEDLGRFAGADRAFLFQFDDRRTAALIVQEWCAEGIEPQMPRLQENGLALADFAPLAEQLLRGEVVAFKQASDWSLLSAAAREEFERDGIRSILLMPMSLGGVVTGFLGLTDVNIERTWPDEIRELHQITCTVFAGAMERQRIEEALRASESRYRALVETSPDAIAQTDLQGRILFVNRRAAVLLGCESPEELTGTDSFRLFAPEEHQRVLAGMQRRLEEGGIRGMRCVMLRKDGARIWVELSSSLMRDERGRPAFFITVAQDITERVRAEEALRETTEELKTYFHFSLDLFCIADTDGYFRRLNREWEKVLGYRLEELEGRKFLDFVHPEDLQATQDVVAMLVEQKEVRNFTNRYRCRDGSYRWIEWRCYPSGRRIFAAARDITERMQTQESLKILAELLDISPVCVIAHDLKGKLLYANEKTYVLHGWSRDEFLAMDLSKIDTPESARLIAPRIDEIMERGEASFEVSHYRKDGTTFPLLVNVRLARWGDRPIFLSAWTDLTERKDEEAKRLEFERQLLHTQRLESLGVLAGGIAHDFNNLLMAIVGNLDILLMNLPAESPLHNGIEQALKASRRAADLTRQMLAYSGRGRFVLRPLDLGELVRENARLFRTAISRTITIDLVAAAGLPLIEADPGQVQQVVMNLIINASEAIGEQSGQVKISTGVQACEEADLRSSRLNEKPPPGKFVYLEVSDTGCGMDEQTQQCIFDPFFSTKFVGRGLGMPAVLGIVRGHGGAIFMESAPGKGTTIRVLFPAKEIREERTVREPSRPVATFSGTVLVVDDDEIVRSVCMDLLHHLGFSTIEAKDGDQALAIFGERAEEISCVILDLTMPRRDGVGTFQEMKRRRPDVKVILCSGYSEQESLSRFAGEGLAGFLQKPYQLGELKDRIERVLKPAP